MSDSSSELSAAGDRQVTIGFQAEAELNSSNALPVSDGASLEFEFLKNNGNDPHESNGQETKKNDAQPAESNDLAAKDETQPAESNDLAAKDETQPAESKDLAAKDEAQPAVSKDQDSTKNDAKPALPKDLETNEDYGRASNVSGDQGTAEEQPMTSGAKDQASKKGATHYAEQQDAAQSPVAEEGGTRGKPGAKVGKPSDASNDPHSHPASRGLRILGVEFAPLNTPMRRRLQTLAVFQWLMSIAILPVLCLVMMGLLLFTPLAPLVLAYIGWVLLFDRKTSQRGGRRWERVRRFFLWRHYRDYFPISLVKSADLDPSHNYLIGYHPHGIISCGAFCNFGTEATGFSAKFPGIRPYLLTLRVNFFWPLLRGYYLAAGLCDVSRSSIQWILSRPGGGNAAIIVVGGAQEALDARPGNYRLTLLKRKGFARMALQTGAHLVPCFSFGENDLFRQASNPPGSRVRAFQQLFKGRMGSSPPLFYGRGVFNYNFGLLPFRHEVITVVGAAIPVEKCEQPTQDQVDSLHQLYMNQLADLFDQHKARYGVPENVRLEFV